MRLFEKASVSLKDGGKRFAYPLARSLSFSGRHDEALGIIQTYATEAEEWRRLREQTQFARQAVYRAWKDTIFNIGRPNTPYAETFPWISADEQKLYFTRRMRHVDEDFFYTTVDSCGGWFTGTNMGSPPNTPQQEAAQMISADGHYLFFMQCENRSLNGWARGGCDLYMSYTADSIWSAPQSFGATINSPGFEGMPCLSPDNRELYFVSEREGGYGGLDLWVARFENGLWQKPRNLGPEVNTPGNETAPFLHIDNHSLYFSSDGHVGMGGADLFLSRRTGDSSWSKPVNLGYPINTPADENSLSINMKGNRLFFASDRDSVAGNFDIYETVLPEPLQPVPVVVVKGYVYDSLTKARLNYASIFVRDAATGESLYHFNSNRGDASYMITLPANKQYIWEIKRISYQSTEAEMNLEGMTGGQDLVYEIPMLPSDYVEPVNDSLVLTIQFPINSARLSDQDREAIRNAMASWMFEQEGLAIFVNGYTDNTGTPMINEQLSFARAGLVAAELQTLGFHPFAIQVHGWGEANPIESNETEEGKNRNRRVEIVVSR